jgi:hypothetical protein
MLKWTLIAAGIVAGLLLLVAIIGALLPKGHVASTRISLRASPETVWSVLADFERHPTWRKGLKTMERLPDRRGLPTWRETSGFGPLTLVVEDFQPPLRMVTRIDDPDLPFGGSWTYQIQPTDLGCDITITEEGEIRNPFFRFMARFIFGYHATLRDYLQSLAVRLGDSSARPEVL